MRTIGLLAVAGLIIALPFATSGYVIYLANLLLTFTVICLGMHLVLGEAGQFSLAQASFYGIGIYTSGLSSLAFGWAFPFSILAAGLAAALVGLCIGALALRMRDIYLALATFAFGEAAQWVFLDWNSVTGGPNGLHIPPAHLFGLELLTDKQAYPAVVAIALIMLGLTIVVSRSRFGRSFRAVRESEVAAMAMGVPVRETKLVAFALSAFFAGIGGGMFALYSPISTRTASAFKPRSWC